MADELIGPKRLASALDIDIRTARNILPSIADVEITPGVWRLTAQGFENWLAERYEATRKKRQEVVKSRRGDVAREEGSVGSEEKASRWSPSV